MHSLRHLLKHIGVCDGNMAEGSIRVDVNVSVRPEGSVALGQRTEIKNLNSIRHVIRAIEYEAQRHVDILDNGNNIQVYHQENISYAVLIHYLGRDSDL